MAVVFSNNATTALASSVTNSATSLTVQDGSVFPTLSGADYTYVTLEDLDGNVEIVKLTARSGNTLTVARAQDGTSARAFSSGSKCELRLTAALLNEVATQADTDTNTTYTAGSGLSLTGTEFANTAPDQTVALTGAGATSISGTYPSFTITSTDTVYTLPFADNSANWNTAYGWGNHASAGYAPASNTTTTNTDQTISGSKIFTSSNNHFKSHLFFDEYSAGRHYLHFATNETTNRVDWRIQTNGANTIIHSWTESNALFRTNLETTGTVTATGGNSTNWNTAYGWGNHASQSYATQSYVGTAISNLVDSSPATLDTLNELAAALGDDPNFATTVTNSIATKLPLAGGTLTGTLNMGANAMTSTGTISSGAITSTVINTGDATLLTLHHDTGADLAQQKSFIDFSFADTNTNETPQVRIGAEVGQNNNADTQEKEGSGAFVVYTNNADTISGAAGASLAERFRVDYVGNTTSTGIVTASGGNSTNWNTAYGWGNHASAGYYAASNPNGYTNDQTAAEILTAIKTVDGSGSGLDADLLDGINSVDLFNNMGEGHTTRTSFDATTASYNFGWRFIQGTTNGPSTNSSQYYSQYVGLGTDYPATGSGSYGMYVAYDRDVINPYISIRYNQNNSLSAWSKISAGKADSLTTARTINGVSFDGTSNITVADSTKLPLSGGTLTGNLNGTTASFSGKVDFQGDAAIEGGSGYGVFKGYTGNNNHFISVRGIVANQTGLSITGGHQTTFVEHAENNDTSGWYFKSNQTGSYAEIARITRTGGMHLQGNKVWHAGNDGSGSGLDADLLDGLQGSRYVANQDGSRYTTDFNTILTSGFYNAQATPANAPGNYGQLIVAKGVDTGLQIYGGYSNNNLWFRGWANSGSTFYSWNKTWHAGNDGSGSGLDADLLDGQQGSYYAPASHGHSYLPLTGGSLSGTLSFSQPVGLSFANGQYIKDNSGGGLVIYSGNHINLNHVAGLTSNGGTVWVSNNDGSGSGLDADLLDGQQGSYYAPASSLGNYITKTGTTVTGNTFKMVFDSGSASGTTFNANHYSMGVDIANGGWSGTNYSDLIIGYHTGIRIGAGYSGIRFYDNSPTTDANNDGNGDGSEELLMTIGGGGSPTSGAHVTVNNDLIAGAIRSDNFQENAGTFLFKKGSGSGRHRHLNLANTTGDPSSVTEAQNPTGISWGQRTDNSGYYMLGLKGQYNNGLSNHSRLAIAWHTGVEIGAAASYGGTRFFSDSPFMNTTEIMSVGKGDGHVRVANNLYANGGNLVWNTGNDGSGSGLDADTVDGVQASRIVYGTNTSKVYRWNGDWNTMFTTVNTGFIDNSSGTNGNPDGFTHHHGFQVRHDNMANAWGYQFMGSYHPSYPSLYHRNVSAGTWSGWKKIWDSNNDGAGSGLDADLLDGQQGSYYLPTTGKAADSELLDGINSNRMVHGQNGTRTDGSSNVSPTTSATWMPSGFYENSNGSGTPSATWYNVIQMRHTNEGNNHGHQIAGSFYSNDLYNRNISNNSYGAWSKSWSQNNDGSGSGLDADLLDGINGTSFLRSDAADTIGGRLTMGLQHALVPADYGIGVTGLYTPTRYQHVWSMGSAYGTNSSGTSYGNMYGLTWTHTNIGTGANQSIAGLSHQLQLRENGILKCAFGTGIWTAHNITSGGQGLLFGTSNDGSGSGLDADLLDGVQGSGYVKTTGNQSISGVKTFTSTLAVSSGQKLTLRDGNHFLQFLSTGYSGAAIDGPILNGHQGGELTTNFGGNNYSLRWNKDGDITSRRRVYVEGSTTNFLGQGPYSSTNLSINMANALFIYSGSTQLVSFSTVTSYFRNQIVADTDAATTGTASATIISRGTVTTTTGYQPQNYHITFQNAAQVVKGSISSSHYATIYSTSSDYRLKEDVQPIDNATERVLALNPVNFKWIDGQQRSDGFLAHELQEHLPEAVTGEKDATTEVTETVVADDGTETEVTTTVPEMQGIDQSKLVPLLVKTIQELEARITALENA